MKSFSTLLIAAIVVPSALAQSPSITLRCEGKPAKAAFEDLSKVAGQNLFVGQSLANQPVILRLKAAPLPAVKARLATIFNGDWIVEKDGERLVAKQTKKPDLFAERLKQIEAQQKLAREDLAKSKGFTEVEARALVEELEAYFAKEAAKTGPESFGGSSNSFAQKGPFATFGRRVFALMDPKELALVSSDHRVVWSTRPTSKQRALPKTLGPAVDQFLREYRLWRDAVGNRQFNLNMQRGIDSTVYQLVQKNLEWSAPEGDDSENATKMLVIGQAWGQGGVSQLELKLVDAKGKYVANCNMSTYELGNRGAYEAPPPTPGEHFKFPLQGIAKELFDAARTNSRWSSESTETKTTLSPELVKVLVNPDQIEPLSIICGPSLIAYADHKELQLVASPPDFGVLPWNGDGKEVDVDAFLAMIQTPGMGQTIENKDGWLTIGESAIADANPGFSGMYARSFDRKQAATLLRNVRETGRMTIEAAAAYLITRPSDESMQGDYVLQLYAAILELDMDLLFDESSRKALRFYGSLDPMQRRAATSGNALLYSALTPAQRAIVDSMAFDGQSYNIQFHPAPGNQNFDYGDIYNSVRSEPTERWPNGLLPGVRVKVSFDAGAIIEAMGLEEGNLRYMTQVDPEQFGMQLQYGSQSPDGRMQRYDQFQVIQQRKLKLNVDYDPEASAEYSAREVQSKSPKVDSIDKLPSEIRALIEQGRKKAADQLKNIPPPPVKR